jgi:hypothetical protein
MTTPLRLAVCVSALAVLVSGCGASKTDSKSSPASASSTTGSTSPTGGASAPLKTTSRSTTSPKVQHARKAPAPKVAKAKPEVKKTSAKVEPRHTKREKERAAARPTLALVESELPPKRRFPKELQGQFMIACKGAKGSNSSCECIIINQEIDVRTEVGQLLAELLAVELAFRHGASLEDAMRHRVPLPPKVARAAATCRKKRA